jgi:hypothetical protein
VAEFRTFENLFLLLVSLAVVHTAFVFYAKLLGKMLAFMGGIGKRLFGRRPAGPVSYRRADG